MKDNTWWKIVKYIGTIIFVLIELFIALHIIDYYEYSDKKIIIFLLIIIYSSIRAFTNGLSLFISRQISLIGAESIKIRELILKEELKDEWNEIKKINDNNKDLQYKVLINSIGIFIIYILAIFNLLY